ncbi:hypothetical protein FS749_007630, partial [Ceratobasidium sp. UAMH 11750]
MSDYREHYGDLVLTKELDQILNQPLDTPPDECLACEDLAFGLDKYCTDYKHRLTEKVQGVTKFTPHDWQLEAALTIHLRWDVFILAGTGFGKTLPFIMNCLLDPTMIVWIVMPLNALANQQARTFTKWKIPSIAVNSTTTHSGIYKDICDSKYQVIILWIEAFTDTSQLLPIIKSTQLAQLHKQVVVVDEAHCIIKWGKLFHPRYAIAGDMRLVLPGHTPYIAAMATANELTREAIKQVLRFGEDSLLLNLGNHRPNLAYSVHRMKKAKASISELLEYFPSKTSLSGYTLIFVDSQATGQLILSILRNHLVPSLRFKVQIYHGVQSDYTKAVLAAGFEREDGFGVMVCTKAMTMGVNFRKVSLVLQVLSPVNAETLLQHGGHAGRDSAMTAEVVLMAQDT